MEFFLNYDGEFLVLGVLGMLLAILRRVVFGSVFREAASGGQKGKMLKTLTLKFEKSYEIKVGIYDRRVFVEKYLCQEKRLGIPILRWRRLPERWTGLILCVGVLEAVVLRRLGFPAGFYLDRLLASIAASAAVMTASLWFESDSLWEKSKVLLADYVSNTLYPRQVHEYESFEAATPVDTAGETAQEKQENLEEPVKTAQKGLKKEEEALFQEVLSDFFGLST